MAADDHRLAAQTHSDDPRRRLEWRRLTVRHGDRLAQIMTEHGWPTADRVGEEAARAAWLRACARCVTRHAPR